MIGHIAIQWCGQSYFANGRHATSTVTPFSRMFRLDDRKADERQLNAAGFYLDDDIITLVPPKHHHSAPPC